MLMDVESSVEGQLYVARDLLIDPNLLGSDPQIAAMRGFLSDNQDWLGAGNLTDWDGRRVDWLDLLTGRDALASPFQLFRNGKLFACLERFVDGSLALQCLQPSVSIRICDEESEHWMLYLGIFSLGALTVGPDMNRTVVRDYALS